MYMPPTNSYDFMWHWDLYVRHYLHTQACRERMTNANNKGSMVSRKGTQQKKSSHIFFILVDMLVEHVPVADPEGGQGVRPPPPFAPRCRLFNIGPKIGPPLFLLVDLIWTPPPFKNPGSAPAYWVKLLS